MTTDYVTAPKSVPDWHDLSACRLFPELDFIDAKPGSMHAYAARIVCSVCPVRLQCAVGALERGEPWGIWGGLDKRDRTEMAREHGYPRPAIVPEHSSDARYKKNGCRCPDCKHAHAVYEADRRARARAKARKRGSWVSPLVITQPCTIGRRRIGVGQLVIPFPGLPPIPHAEPLAA